MSDVEIVVDTLRRHRAELDRFGISWMVNIASNNPADAAGAASGQGSTAG